MSHLWININTGRRNFGSSKGSGSFWLKALFLKGFLGIHILSLALIFSCSKKPLAEDILPPSSSTPYLYVVSGACYAGGVTTSSASGTISRFDKNTGTFLGVLVDYNTMFSGDVPVSIVDGGSVLYVLVENASGRRIDTVHKQSGLVSTWLLNSTIFSAVLRSLAWSQDGGLLISKSSAIEKVSPSKVRVPKGANPYVNNPGSSCATSTTLISSVKVLPNGNIIYTHANTSPNNKFAIISSSGYSSTADCKAAQAAPATTAMPTDVLHHSSGKLLVAYGSTTLTSNFIYSYNLDLNTNAISSPTQAYYNNTYLLGPSQMVEDPETGKILVANGASTMNNIYRFTLDSSSGLLTLESTLPFIGQQVYTRCVSDMLISN